MMHCLVREQAEYISAMLCALELKALFRAAHLTRLASQANVLMQMTLELVAGLVSSYNLC